jgi:hypothetical protein
MEKEIERYFNQFFHLNGGERMKFEDIDWACIYMYEELTDQFIEKTHQCLHQYLDFDTNSEKWSFVFEYNQVSETFLRKHHSEFDREVWSVISAFQELSEDFMCEFKDELDWIEISQNQRFSEEFAVQFKLLLDWEAIIGRNIFTFDFILQNTVLSDGVVSRLGQKYTAEIKNLLEKYRSEGKK